MTDKKLHDNKELIKEMNKQLMALEQVIKEMDEKRGKIYLDWLKTQNKYLVWEEGFDPTYLRKYKRSEIVLANFGFNVGAEYGGMHYAVVVRDSSKTNPNINVVPLSSLEDEEDPNEIHKDRVSLGVIEDINQKNAVAIPDQMRSISKIRIFKPRKSKDRAFKLTNDQMDLIDEKIRKLYTKLRSEER